ncbi:MAG: YebC/PmpR family DNA-binding transcriptional regulator [Pseudomonadota bacterium]
MSGHSKWKNIKFKKALQDKKRGKLFSKLIREITVAARVSGDVATNPRLRLVIDKALSNNMTRDTIDRAVKRGSGGDEGANLEDVVYEGYGAAGVAILVEAMTDNRTRTVAEVRHAFSKAGGNMGAPGSVAYLFSKRGEIMFAPGCDEDKIMEVAIEAGADDVLTHDDGSVEVITTEDAFSAVKDAMEKAGLTPAHAETTMHAATQVPVDKETAEKVLRLIDMLEDLDDTQEVYSNADMPDDIYT